MVNNIAVVQSNNNYTLTKLIRTGISPICAMIGTSAYYGQVIANPILGSLNSLLFGKKLGLDIWNLNQKPSSKTKVINSSKKILLGLGTIGLVNYAKFVQYVDNDMLLKRQLRDEPCFWPPCPTERPRPTYPPFTTVKPIVAVPFVDWDTYISLNAYGIANVINGLTELIPNRFAMIQKIANMATGSCLISSGVAMGINNDFNNAYAVPTIIAGINEIIHNLLPMETVHNNTEMQETPFTNETTRLINASISDYQSTDNSMNDVDSMSEINLDRASLNWDYSYAYTLGGV